MKLNQRRLKELLSYDAESGLFTWLADSGNGIKTGMVAGCVNGKGYRLIGIDGVAHTAHRLAFLYMEGEMPAEQVDHINRSKDDNRWCNLRHATAFINNANKSNSNLFTGVDFDEDTNKWRVRARQKNGKRAFLGCFDNQFSAVLARRLSEISEAI